MHNVLYPLLQYHTEVLPCPETPHPNALPVHPSLPTNPRQPLTFSLSLSFAFSRVFTVGIVHYVAFWDWLLSLNNKHLRSFYVFLWLGSSFLIIVEYYSTVWTCCHSYSGFKLAFQLDCIFLQRKRQEADEAFTRKPPQALAASSNFHDFLFWHRLSPTYIACGRYL